MPRDARSRPPRRRKSPRFRAASHHPPVLDAPAALPYTWLPDSVPAWAASRSRGGEGLDDAQVRERVRGLLASGRLPSEDPLKLWAGPSMAKPCSCCGEIISTATEYELDFSGTLTILFHPRCYAIWNEERKRMTEQRRRDRPSTASGS